MAGDVSGAAGPCAAGRQRFFTGLPEESEARLLARRNGRAAGIGQDASGAAAALPLPGKCFACGRDLSADDTGAHKKFINRGADTFLCIPCLAELFGVSEAGLREKVEYFRRSGCTLFPPDDRSCGKGV